MNIWAILVCSVFYVGLGTLWYSKLLLGKQWMKHLGVTEDKLEMKPTDYVFSILGGILGSVFLAVIMQIGGIYAISGSIRILWGFLIGLVVAGIVFTTSSSQVVFSGKKWQSWLIDSGYHASALIIVGIVLSAWV